MSVCPVGCKFASNDSIVDYARPRSRISSYEGEDVPDLSVVRRAGRAYSSILLIRLASLVSHANTLAGQ